jgi:3-hydroxyacyl-[acyl-carrier-protein] dehydratase
MKVVIGVKYWGGCNPLIDRAKLALEIEKLLPPEYSLTTDQTFNPWDIGIMICGCPTSCADKPDIRNLARKWIIVAGSSVDLNNALEEGFADIVVRKLNLSAANHGES